MSYDRKAVHEILSLNITASLTVIILWATYCVTSRVTNIREDLKAMGSKTIKSELNTDRGIKDFSEAIRLHTIRWYIRKS